MIELRAVSARQGAFALRDVSFSVPTGRTAAVVGPTGGGKTTLLELVAGLRPPAAGRVLLRGVDVTGSAPAARRLGYVPQDAAVFPAMSVRENLGFSLAVRGDPAATTAARVSELADRLGLAPLLDRRAVGLSGGEAQRVALGRALASRPDVLLLDEPLSAVDDATRGLILELLLSLKGTTTVLHVTHDAAEAARVADLTVRVENGTVRAG